MNIGEDTQDILSEPGYSKEKQAGSPKKGLPASLRYIAHFKKAWNIRDI